MTNDLKPIHNWDDHAAAMIELERVWGAPGGTPDGDRLEILATLIDAFENQNMKFDPPDPIAAIEFHMDQRGMTRKDLEPILGSRARVSEVLNRKRGLSLQMIRNLHEKLGISLEVLVQSISSKTAA